jgi:type IV pilus assembly protein PilV
MSLARLKVCHSQRGLSLIEVLVTVVVLLVGLLGMVVLLANSQKAESEAYQRAQALVLLQDMATRINANRAVAPCYAITDAAAGAPFMGTNSTVAPACGLGTPTAYTQAIADLTAWNDLLLGATESLDGADVGTLTGARGCVSADLANRVYTISVAWQGRVATSAPPVALTCGTGEYGNENLRRVVSLVVRLANLN